MLGNHDFSKKKKKQEDSEPIFTKIMKIMKYRNPEIPMIKEMISSFNKLKAIKVLW